MEEYSLSLVLMHLCEYVLEIFRWFSFGSNLEHHGDEHVTAGLSHIELNASDHADFDIWDFLDNSVDIPASDLVHRVGQLGHWLLCQRDFLIVRLKSLPNVDKLVIERISTCWNYYRGFFVRLWLPLVILEPQVGINRRTASIIIEFLAITAEFSKFSFFCNANMRGE